MFVSITVCLAQVQPVDWAAAEASLQVDRNVKEVAWATPGTTAGLAVLEEFCSARLKNFDKHRNDPVINGLSNLSPWFHFGKESYLVAICFSLAMRYKISGQWTHWGQGYCRDCWRLAGQ